METSLHRQLKEVYADEDAQVEVPLGDYRIDVVRCDELIEIQHGSLSAIRDKIQDLTKNHRVLVVKPIIASKRIIRQDEKAGNVLSRRRSPKRETVVSLFSELIYFTRAFPHPNLTLEVPLVHVEEWRFPGHGRRRRQRKNDFQVEDLKLEEIGETYRFRTFADLVDLLPTDLPQPFHTGTLADSMGIKRGVAQHIAYCLREMHAVEIVGKDGNALLYEIVPQKTKAVA
jgi:hypothetical protein